MTMPVKMTCHHSRDGSAEYIRKDLAEDLARAASEIKRLWAIGIGGRDLSWRIALEQAIEGSNDALARYNEAVGDK